MYKRQVLGPQLLDPVLFQLVLISSGHQSPGLDQRLGLGLCLLYTSDAADERSSVDLGGRRFIKKKNSISIARRDYDISPYITTIQRRRKEPKEEHNRRLE